MSAWGRWGLRSDEDRVTIIDGRTGEPLEESEAQAIVDNDTTFDWSILDGRLTNATRKPKLVIPDFLEDPKSDPEFEAELLEAMTKSLLCPHCGKPMVRATARVCFGGGRGEMLQMPPSCTDPECQANRDERALAAAVAAGVIDP